MDDFVNEGCLGAGTCSAVFQMRHRVKTNLVMAVKQMHRSSTSPEENKRIMMDLHVVTKSYDCTNIVQCYGIFFTSGDVWICMEVMSTCLDKLLHELHRPFPEKVIGKITVAITTALDYLKSKHNVMHRDVKPSNMLLSYQGVVKLCDFGISGKLKDSIARSRQLGCVGYMAPERLETSTYDVRADVWSLGIALFELATGSFPYTGTQIEFAIMTKIISDPPPSLPHHIPFTASFRNFVDMCLQKDLAKRPKYPFLMTTDFFIRHNKEPYDVLEWMKGLPLPHLHHAECFTPNIDPQNKMATSLINTSLGGSLGSNVTLSPEDFHEIGNNSLTDSVELIRPSKHSVEKNTLNVTLVAAPFLDFSSDCGHPAACANKDPVINLLDRTSQLDISEQNALACAPKEASGYNQPSHVKLSDSSVLNYISNEVADKSNDLKMLSQASSGYGSAGSDSRPDSVDSNSRLPSNAAQILDSINRHVNRIPPLPSSRLPKASKEQCRTIVHSERLKPNGFFHENETSAVFPTAKKQIPLLMSLSNQRSSSKLPNGTDQWSMSSTLRTTHRVPLSSSNCELIGSESKATLRKLVNSTCVNECEDTGDKTEQLGNTNKIPVCNRPSPRQGTYSRRNSVCQARSTSAGAQLRRSPAQRWTAKPACISSNYPQSKTSVPHVPHGDTPCQHCYSNTQAQPKNISPQQYHHHYYYYYYNNLHPDITSLQIPRALTPPLSATNVYQCPPNIIDKRNIIGRSVTPSCGTTCMNLLNSVHTAQQLPSLSGRMCQRLYTHPLPKQSTMNSSLTSLNPKFPKLGSNSLRAHSRSPAFTTCARIPAEPAAHLKNYMEKMPPHIDNRYSVQTMSRSNSTKQCQRSTSQPAKSKDWLSFETEL